MIEQIENSEQSTEQLNKFDESLQRNFRSVETGDQANQGDWIDIGMQDVPVNAVDVSGTHVHGKADFHKVSYDEVAHGFETLENEIRPAVENGADVDTFRALDEQRGVTFPNGTQKIYEAFYGQDAIRLNKDGNSYEVVNGYHRLYVAKEFGIPTVPAHVIEKRLY